MYSFEPLHNKSGGQVQCYQQGLDGGENTILITKPAAKPPFDA